jgi:hypothetical protein
MVKKMSSDKTLEDIEESLKPKSKPQTTPQPMPLVAFDFSEISSQLKQLVAEKNRSNDMLQMFTQIDFDVKALVAKTDSNLKESRQILSRVDARLKVVDSLEAKWNLLLERVSGVLNELERVLRQM